MNEINKEYNNEKIAITAVVSMYGATLFIIFQLIIPLIPALLLMITNSVYISIGGYILSTVIEIIIIKRYLKKHFNFEEYYVSKQNGEIFVFNEKILQRLFNITAILGILFINIVKIGIGIKYFFIVINGFSIIYFLIFFVVRFKIEKKISYQAVFSILLAIIQIFIGVIGYNILEILFGIL